MQRMLPTRHKLQFVMGLSDGQPCAGAICSAMGQRGIYLFGATADAGLTNKAAYAVHWRVLEWLKALHCTEYDLHGVNIKTNPGVYSFKAGLSGKNGEEVESPGDFDAYSSPQARLLLRLADVAKQHRDHLKSAFGRYVSP
jgi:lipid II:glycine glycyltransferase (peptidoglycan interpeptide bridge formation enzyme)